jgi:2',3'-cyclic-nucleotide 2'-phosphodiesterase (5'-nucleotidase family)
MKKRLWVLLLALILLLSGCASGTQPAPAPDEPGDTVEKNGDIVILYTSDVHCGINSGFGYAGLRQVRDAMEKKGYTTILVDNGDAIQGEPIGTMSKGEAIIDLMNAVGYDVAIPGNHEFDYTVERFLELAGKANFPYISCNFNKEGELLFDPYLIKEAAGKKIAFVGVTTPETLTSSTPRYFMDDQGSFIYGFLQDETGEKLYQAVQSAVDDARAEGADYVVVLGHLGYYAASSPWNYADVIENTTGVDILLDGHSHDSEQVVMKNKEGAEVIRSACGTKLANIGYVIITAEGEVSVGLYSWNNDVSAAELMGVDNEVSRQVAEAERQLEELLGEVVASTAVDLTVNDPEAVDSGGNPIRMIRRAETNLGDLCADAYLDQSGADAAFINSGGIRVSIARGDITRNDILTVHPFGNSLTVAEVTGQQLLDALEWGARSVPEECAAFLQVAGMTYEIHSYIESGCKADESGMFTGVEGPYRVRNVTVRGEPLDLEKTYTVASIDYILTGQGDGFAMFAGCKVLQDAVKLDNQLLIDYITETLGGVVETGYMEPTGQGRITIIDTEP